MTHLSIPRSFEDELINQPIFKMHHLVFIMDRYADAELQKTVGISYSTYLFLMTISAQSGCSQKMLADCLGYTQAAISKSLTHLLSQQFVQQIQDSQNRRQNIITLTSVGVQKLTEAQEVIDHLTTFLMNKMKKNEIDALNTSLNSLLSHLQSFSQSP